jgi:hypothetical protein
MADPTTTPAVAPVAPAPAPAPNVATNPVVARPAVAPTGKQSNLITNPMPKVDPDAPVKEVAPSELPQSTIAEMEAGKKALERNKPVAVALENARNKPETAKQG